MPLSFFSAYSDRRFANDVHKVTFDVSITNSAKDSGVSDRLTLLAQISKPAYTISQSGCWIEAVEKRQVWPICIR